MLAPALNSIIRNGTDVENCKRLENGPRARTADRQAPSGDVPGSGSQRAASRSLRGRPLLQAFPGFQARFVGGYRSLSSPRWPNHHLHVQSPAVHRANPDAFAWKVSGPKRIVGIAETSGHRPCPDSEGHPLGHREAVPEAFFPTLQSLLKTMHQRKMAYVDLHKRENVLVGDDGQPYLIDFQISFVPSWLLRVLPTTWILLSILQKSDDYHLEKLRLKSSPAGSDEGIKRPWWIRVHRAVAMPFRQIRRRMLVKIKVRSGEGRVHTEHFTEEGLRESQPLA